MWLLGGDFVGYENRTFGLEGNVILQIYWDSSGPWYMSATYWDCRRHHSANIYIIHIYIYLYFGPPSKRKLSCPNLMSVFGF